MRPDWKFWPEPEPEPDCYDLAGTGTGTGTGLPSWKSGRIRPDWPDLAGFDKISMLDFELFQLWPMFSLSTIDHTCHNSQLKWSITWPSWVIIKVYAILWFMYPESRWWLVTSEWLAVSWLGIALPKSSLVLIFPFYRNCLFVLLLYIGRGNFPNTAHLASYCRSVVIFSSQESKLSGRQLYHVLNMPTCLLGRNSL